MNRPLPNNPDIERAVVSVIMSVSDAIVRVADTLPVAAFYTQKYADIYTAVLSLFNAGKGVDLLTVQAELGRAGLIGDGNGQISRVELTTILSDACSDINLETHAAILLQLYAKREVAVSCISTFNLATDDNSDGLDVLEAHSKESTRIMSLVQNSRQAAMPDIVDEVMNRITTIRETGEPIGLSTGLRWLDAKIYGLCPTDLYIVAARPGMGKSALAMTFAMHQAVDLSIPILLFSLEMSAGQLVSRALSRLSGVPHEWLKNPGGLSHIQLADMGNAAARLKDRPLFIDDQAALTVEQIRARSIRIHKEHGIQAVYVDYIQLVAPSGGRGRSREQEVSEVSRGLKALAKELKIPVVALSQLSRKIEERQKSDQRPKLSDLRESGAIEQDADCVVFIYSPQNFNPDVTMAEAELIVAKHRNGSVGTVKATFEKNTVHFSEREAEQYSPLAPPREEKDNPF